VRRVAAGQAEGAAATADAGLKLWPPLRTEQSGTCSVISLTAAKAEGKHIVLNWTFTDTSEALFFTLGIAPLTYVRGRACRPRRTQLLPGARQRLYELSQAYDVSGSGGNRQDQGHRQSDAACGLRR